MRTHDSVTIHYLAEYPHYADELAGFSYAEWPATYELRGESLSDVVRSYRERARIDSLPLALVALASGVLIGTVSLKHHDLEILPGLTPWLGGLFVVPEWRKRGVASQLMQRAINEARRLDLERLFLWTSSAEALYLRLGWRSVERIDYGGKQIVVMRIDPRNAD
ncbi:MAG: GNAT family N-acetyltransferase [Verrucomicrobiota bacterium]|nr:GNAT family N-acetyltransferase [Verrucomicrobiota bacterium]